MVNPFEVAAAKKAENNPFYEASQQKPAKNHDSQRKVAQVALGAAKAHPISWGLDLFKLASDAASQNVLAEIAENDPDLIREVAEKSRSESIEKLPTQEMAEQLIEEKTGLPLTAKTGGDEAIRFISTLGASGVLKSAAKQSKRLIPANKVTETMKSGLTKLKSVEAAHPERGIITSARQEKAISKLNEEAADLTQKSVEKHVPVAKQIQEGHDFNFNAKFKPLEESMIKANPDIDITPMSRFLSETSKKYRGLPKELLATDSKKVLKEASAYRNNPQTQGANLYKLYRINNKKLNSIYEQRLLHGKQQEYADFLVDMNKSIAQSFENTLPKNGAWITEFKQLNKQFGDVQKANKTLSQLENVLNGEATPSNIKKLASNPQAQKKLALSMGDEGAKEVIQISKDLKMAQDSIKKMSVKDLTTYEKILPLSVILPGFNIPKGVALAGKAYTYGRRGYGYLMTRPATRKAVKDAVEAVSKHDVQAYKKAAAIIIASNLSNQDTTSE